MHREQAEQMIRIGPVLTFTTGCLLCLLWAGGSGLCDDCDGLNSRVEKIKRQYDFYDWAGITRLQSKEISRLPFSATDFTRYPQVRFYGDEDKSINVSIQGNEELSGADISMGIRETPRKAQEAILRGFAYITKVDIGYVKAEEGNEMDIGDVCFYPESSEAVEGSIVNVEGLYLGRLYFTRNNVVVSIINNPVPGKKWLDIASLARFIDEKLREELKKKHSK